MMTFTGSTEVGRRIAATAGQHVKRAVLELGGNAPFIVLDDADLDRAIDIAVFGKFFNSGQICIAINRMIVDRRVHDAFLDRLAKRVAALRWGATPARKAPPSARSSIKGSSTGFDSSWTRRSQRARAWCSTAPRRGW
jgi:acyl-CoA reductase-like NAD-dependent aldehyde dehydrogenase